MICASLATQGALGLLVGLPQTQAVVIGFAFLTVSYQLRALEPIYLKFVNLRMETDVINIDPDILGGTPVFSGTRVPVESLFDHLESGISLEAFLDDFPSVTREQVVRLLELAGKVVSATNFKQLYEAAS